jgi:hypothetical protein
VEIEEEERGGGEGTQGVREDLIVQVSVRLQHPGRVPQKVMSDMDVQTGHEGSSVALMQLRLEKQ